MIVIKTSRDESRTLQKAFFPYMIMLATSKISDADIGSNDYLSGKIMLSLIMQVRTKVDRRLLTTANNFSFNLSDAEGIALYTFLMSFPIEMQQVYMNNLRQRLCDKIYRQLLEPVAAGETETIDFEE